MRFTLCLMLSWAALAAPVSFQTDPVTRYVHVSYLVPASAPAEVRVQCEVQGPQWKPASVWPHVSESALELMQPNDWLQGINQGTIIEQRAAGLMRTLVWNPFLQGISEGNVRFRIRLLDGAKQLAEQETAIPIDNSDVMVINDWSKVVQQQSVSVNPAPNAPVWWFRGRESLEVKEKGIELPPLTYPLDLRGPYAAFVLLPGKLGAVELRLSGDERSQIFTAWGEGREVFWRWSDLTRQHLIVQQPYRTVNEYEDGYRAHLKWVRLVPLTPQQVSELDRQWAAPNRKHLVVGYNEPYSWAFYEKVVSNLQHMEPLLAFAEARVDMVDIQIGRGGSRMVNETRVGSQLIADTFGDPVRGKVPHTNNVGRMQQYTNTLATQLKYSQVLGMKPRANLGATNCYPGTPLESEFSRQHPDWRKGGQLRYEIPEVRKFVLSLYEEALEAGAVSLSIDWCRYPNSVTDKATVTNFFRELRALAGRYGERRGRRVDILTRFPARGVTGWEHMDYAAWAREGLVDYLAPSNIQGRHMNFDLTEYLAAVKGTKSTLLPAVDGLEWGLPLPGMIFHRILKQYEEGAGGVYVYQCDAPVLGSPETRRFISLIGSLEALRGWRERELAAQPRYSKGIYITPPHEQGTYKPWGRLRVWTEGLAPGEVELLVDGKIMNRYQSPPYVLTSEQRSDDSTIPPGKHVLQVRARDGAGWLEQEFQVEFAR